MLLQLSMWDLVSVLFSIHVLFNSILYFSDYIRSNSRMFNEKSIESVVNGSAFGLILGIVTSIFLEERWKS